MAVAVDDARHHEFSGKIDDGGVGRGGDRRRGADVADAAVLDDDRDVALGRRAGAVDERGMGQDGYLGGGAGGEQDRGGQDQESTCTHDVSSSVGLCALPARAGGRGAVVGGAARDAGVPDPSRASGPNKSPFCSALAAARRCPK
jgi:hypothetical protein